MLIKGMGKVRLLPLALLVKPGVVFVADELSRLANIGESSPFYDRRVPRRIGTVKTAEINAPGCQMKTTAPVVYRSRGSATGRQ